MPTSARPRRRPSCFPTLRRLACGLLLGAAAAAAAPSAARAIILLRTADPGANTTEPTGALAGSGWQFQGSFGGFLCTPIAPKFFISAAHLGTTSATVIFRGVSYPVARDPNTPSGEPPRYLAYRVPGSDLLIHQIEGTFPAFAPVWTTPGAEVGKPLVVFGRGTQRGAAINAPAGSTSLRGWEWGPGDAVQRWGTNAVTATVNGGSDAGALLYATFDQNAGPEEAHLSNGDSGGGVFIQDAGGVWRLAGINYSVDGGFYRKNTPPTAEDPNAPITAALFDTAGLFRRSSGGNYIPTQGPTGFYSTPIADRLSYINVVLGNAPLAKVSIDMVFGFRTDAGKRYRVERCDDLATGSWTPLAEDVAGTGGTALVTDFGAASLTQRFYRVVTLP